MTCVRLFLACVFFLLAAAMAHSQDYSTPPPDESYAPPSYPPPSPYGAYTTMPLGPDGWTETTGPNGYYSETIPLGGGAYQTWTQPTPYAPAYPMDGAP